MGGKVTQWKQKYETENDMEDYDQSALYVFYETKNKFTENTVKKTEKCQQ